jgi:chromosomal replication initiator protein
LVDIGKPDFELKAAITLIKAEQRMLKLSMEQAQLVAGNIDSARQIEGFITRLITEVNLRKKPINEALIRALLGKTQRAKDDTPPPLRPLELVKGVATHFNVNSKQLRGGKRVKQLVTPRHIAMYLLRVDYKLPLTEIGSLFSDRDHTTVMHAVEKITTQLKDVESLRIDVEEVRRELYT